MVIEFDDIDWQGKVAAGGAALVALAIGYEAFGPMGTPGVIILVMSLGAAIGALVALTRTQMPNGLRAGLMLVLIVTVLAAALRSDFVLMKPVRRDFVAALANDDATVYVNSDGSIARVEERQPKPAAAAGAAVAITGNGDAAHWASDAQAALDRSVAKDVPGAGDWKIAGEASVPAQAPGAVAIDWHVDGAGGEAHCGFISVTAAQPTAAYAALRDRFSLAVERSVTARRAACI